LELSFDARKNGRRRFVEVFAWRLLQRAHNLLKVDTTTERGRGRTRERARQIVAMVVVMVQSEKK